MSYQDKNRERKPAIQIEIRLVGHGFQFDLYDNTMSTSDGQGVVHACECHDFADSGPSICDRAVQISEALIQAVRKIR